MTQRTAAKRYFKIFIPAMLIYVIGVFAITWAEDKSYLAPNALYFLTLIPIFGIFAWMWAQWRYVQELDEYLSKLQTDAMMYGFMIITAIAMGWGLMELMTDVPRIPIFFAGPGFCFAYGISFAILKKRAGIKGFC